MGTICFSMSGEGRGHATRVRSLTEALRAEGHRVELFAPGDAYDFLAAVYADQPDVPVHQIPGLKFHYTAGHQVNYPRTVWGGVGYLAKARAAIAEIEGRLREVKPDVCVVDFEPLLPRACKRVGVPFLSINHQHFLIVSDFGKLPKWLQREARTMALVVRAYHSGQRETVVSAFFRAPLKPKYQPMEERGEIERIGILLRPEVLQAKIRNEGHITSYIRKFASEELLDALAACGREVRLYGLGEQPNRGCIRFLPIDPARFVEDLASCDALICTAGNQLLGECLYLGKPVLALPEDNNFEQYLNAWFLKDMGAGTWKGLHEVTVRDIAEFLEEKERYREKTGRAHINGTPRALAAIRRWLPNAGQVPEPAPDPPPREEAS